MKVLVAYESRGGRTKRAASAIGDAARAAGHEVDVRAMAETRPEDVAAADIVFVGTWVQGFLFFGVGPAKAARRWVAQLPSLSGKRSAVFCTYALNPRSTLSVIEADLAGKGATVEAAAAFHHRSDDREATEFAGRVIGAVG